MGVYRVSQVARWVKDTVEANSLLADLLVTGEVTNCSRSPAGHYYFTLKDADSQLKCVKFRGGVGEEHLRNGAAVTTHGRISFYQATGALQYYVDLVQPEGVGELYMEFLRVKAKLEEEGLFDQARKRPLPAFPKRIAVITSRAGAVLHDIQNILARRYPVVEMVLIHTAVQGEQAPAGIITAFKTINLERDLDLVILARGGGSLEELAAFNREDVARAIHGCRFPVVSAVGHETDFTIGDFVADLRAPTPSAAAELVTPDIRDLRERLADCRRSLVADVMRHVGRQREAVGHAQARLAWLAPDLAAHRQRVDELTRAAMAVMQREMAAGREHIASRVARLGSLHPENTLARGYALVERSADHGLVSRTQDVESGDGIKIRVSDGTFGAQVAGKAAGAGPRKARAKARPAPAGQGALWE